MCTLQSFASDLPEFETVSGLIAEGDSSCNDVMANLLNFNNGLHTTSFTMLQRFRIPLLYPYLFHLLIRQTSEGCLILSFSNLALEFCCVIHFQTRLYQPALVAFWLSKLYLLVFIISVHN